MLEQIFDSFRKAAESSLQTQQEMFKQFSQQWPSTQLHAAGSTADVTDELQKRWRTTLTTTLAHDRALLDAAFEKGIDLVEQTFKLYEARSPEDCRRVVENLWRQAFELAKEHSDSQVRVMQTVSSTWLELEPKDAPRAAESES